VEAVILMSSVAGRPECGEVRVKKEAMRRNERGFMDMEELVSNKGRKILRFC